MFPFSYFSRSFIASGSIAPVSFFPCFQKLDRRKRMIHIHSLVLAAPFFVITMLLQNFRPERAPHCGVKVAAVWALLNHDKVEKTLPGLDPHFVLVSLVGQNVTQRPLISTKNGCLSHHTFFEKRIISRSWASFCILNRTSIKNFRESTLKFFFGFSKRGTVLQQHYCRFTIYLSQNKIF